MCNVVETPIIEQCLSNDLDNKDYKTWDKQKL